MSEALQLRMETKIEKLKFEEKFVKELQHLHLDKDSIVFWGDDDDETDQKKRTKKTSKRDWKEAEFGERLDWMRNCWEDMDPLDQLANLEDLNGVDQETFSLICDKIKERR
jgi:hypothetical protein